MKRWSVKFPDEPGSADMSEVAADRMTISDAGVLIFWRGHDGQYADTIHLAIADGQWISVEALP